MKTYLLGFTSALGLLAAVGTPAFADGPAPNELPAQSHSPAPNHTETDASSVETQSSRNVPVLGVPVATPLSPSGENAKFALMTVSLGLDTGLFYDSNIYKSSGNEQSDMIATVAPTVALKSSLPQQKFSLSFTPEVGRYLSKSKNDYVDWTFQGRASFDITPTDKLGFDAEYTHDHVAIGGFDDDTTSALKDPTEFDLFSTSGLWEGSKDLLKYELGGNFDSYDYDNVQREDGTISIQDDRDRDVYEAVGKLGYEFIPTYLFYVSGSWNTRNYDNRIDSSLLYPRDSTGERLYVGVSRDVSTLPITFDAAVGYMGQNYDAAQLRDVNDMDFKFNGKWTITDLDVWNVWAKREIKDSSLEGVSSSLQTRFGTDYTHTYSEQLFVGANFGYTNADYQSNVAIAGIDREDDLYDAGLHAQYALTQHSSIIMQYAFRDRESNRAFTDYTDHVVGVSWVLK